LLVIHLTLYLVVDLQDGAVHQDENRQGTLSQLVDAVKKECGSAVNSAFLTF
jgi:hypothetical protein